MCPFDLSICITREEGLLCICKNAKDEGALIDSQVYPVKKISKFASSAVKSVRILIFTEVISPGAAVSRNFAVILELQHMQGAG